MSETKRGNPNWRPGVSGNPSGRRADGQPPSYAWTAASAHLKTDGWTNMLSGMGTYSHDRTTHTRFFADPVCFEDALELYRGDPTAARMAEIVPDEVMRPGFTAQISLGDEGDGDRAKEIQEAIEQGWEDLGVFPALWQGFAWRFAYGGGAVLLNVNDGQTVDKPLNLDAVSEFNSVSVLEPRELYPVSWYNDANKPGFGTPAQYMFAPLLPGPTYDPASNGERYSTKPNTLTKIHESRLIVFTGPKVTRVPQRGQLFGWGDNIFTRVKKALAQFNSGLSSIATLVDDFAPAVIQIEDLAKMIAEDNKQLFGARMQSIQMAKSTIKAILLDTKETYKREQTPVTGISDLSTIQAKVVAMVCGVPFSIMFGDAPGGLNGSGASGDQMQIHYSRMMAARKLFILPGLTKITKCYLAAQKMKVQSVSVKGGNYSQPTAKEEAETRKMNSDVDIANMEHAVFTAAEVRRRYEGDQYVEGALHVEPDADDPTTTPGDDDADAFREENGKTLPASTPAPMASAPANTNAGPNIQQQAMNGAQVTSLIEVVTSVAEGTISRLSGLGILKIAFQLSDEQAQEVLGPEDFEPTKPDPAPAPMIGGGPIPPKAPVPPAKPDAPAVPEEKKPTPPKGE